MSTQAPSMSRNPANYTANNEVRRIVRENPIPSEMIGECISSGFLKRRSSKNPMNVTLRYENGAQYIELTINLEGSKVFAMDSSFMREEPTIGE